jgi:putative transposase
VGTYKKRPQVGKLESRKLVVYLIDECHLLWGDVCGYLWGRRNERIEIPLVNQREKQTYYGAVNYLTKQLVLREYATANSENTVAFLKDLQSLNSRSQTFDYLGWSQLS